MTKPEKIQFVNNFMQSMREDFLKKIDNVPEDWDGLELREWIADKFDNERFMGNPYRKKNYRKRLSAYKNEIYISNL